MNFDPAQMIQAGGTILVIVLQALVLYVFYGVLERFAGERAVQKLTRDD